MTQCRYCGRFLPSGYDVDYCVRGDGGCDERSEHTQDWCRMPDDPSTGRFQVTVDCPACHERLAWELRSFIARRDEDNRARRAAVLGALGLTDKAVVVARGESGGSH